MRHECGATGAPFDGVAIDAAGVGAGAAGAEGVVGSGATGISPVTSSLGRASMGPPREHGGKRRRLGIVHRQFLSAKTVARIERGEVDEPHGDTLATIAKRLGVKPEQIKSY